MVCDMAGQFPLVLALVWCLVLASSAQQPDTGSLLENIPAHTLQGVDGQCPSADTKAQVLLEIHGSVGAALIHLCSEFGRLPHCPASSCGQILRNNSASESGYYWIRGDSANSSIAGRLYCDMESSRCCNASKGWTRIAYLNMNDSTHSCPADWRTVPASEDHPIPTCDRIGRGGCVSAIYPSYGVRYRNVCGRVLGYQFGATDAFQLSRLFGTIDSVYIDGVSVTYGQQPRQHIWTFAAGIADSDSEVFAICPCTKNATAAASIVPSFVGQDYFCETGFSSNDTDLFYETDPLWDGQGCSEDSECCSFNNPPWFCRQLDSETSEDIEVRICGFSGLSIEGTPVELVEIFVQ